MGGPRYLEFLSAGIEPTTATLWVQEFPRWDVSFHNLLVRQLNGEEVSSEMSSFHLALRAQVQQLLPAEQADWFRSRFINLWGPDPLS
jgi:hypothetical protein